MTSRGRTVRPLDPARDPERWERMVASILARAEPARRQRERGVVGIVIRWRWRVVSAAACLAAAAVAALLVGLPHGQGPAARTQAAPTAIDPLPVAAWMTHVGSLDPIEVFAALNQGGA